MYLCSPSWYVNLEIKMVISIYRMNIKPFIEKTMNLAYEKSVQVGGFRAFESVKMLIIRQLLFFCKVIHSLLVRIVFIISPCVVNILCRYSNTSVPTLEQVIQNRYVFWQREFGETRLHYALCNADVKQKRIRVEKLRVCREVGGKNIASGKNEKIKLSGIVDVFHF